MSPKSIPSSLMLYSPRSW